MISIIIPTLNEEHFLPILLSSLGEQSNKDFEVIVVDGYSKDDTVSVAKSYARKLPKFKIRQHVGPSVPKQRNAGAQIARGEWLVFVDSDGAFMPGFIDRLVAFTSKHSTQLVTTWFSPDSDVTSDAILTLFINIAIESSILFRRPFTPGPLTIVSRKAYDAVGGYDESLEFGEDYDFGKKLHEKGYTLTIIPESLCVYSMRRIRAEGKLKVLQQYAKAVLSVLITNRSPRTMEGYIMGGELYAKSKKHIRPSAFKRFRQQINTLIRELIQ